MRFYIVALSPLFGGSCKFYPSCSNYAYEAVSRHGARRGLVLALRRLLRCRPFTKGGFDPVPEVLCGPEGWEEVKAPQAGVGQVLAQPGSHRPTQAVVAESWSGAGTLGVERRR